MKNTATVTKYTKISYPFLKSDQDHIWSGKELKGGWKEINKSYKRLSSIMNVMEYGYGLKK